MAESPPALFLHWQAQDQGGGDRLPARGSGFWGGGVFSVYPVPATQRVSASPADRQEGRLSDKFLVGRVATRGQRNLLSALGHGAGKGSSGIGHIGGQVFKTPKGGVQCETGGGGCSDHRFT